MKLSQFDLQSYRSTKLTYRYTDEWSRPGLTNFLGSVQAEGDPTMIKNLIFAPVSSAEESTCALTINGDFMPASGVKTRLEWAPSSIKRKALFKKWQISSELILVSGKPCALQKVEIQNVHSARRKLELGVRLSGRCVNRGTRPWFWEVPVVSTGVFELVRENGLDPLIERFSDGLLFQERKLDLDSIDGEQAGIFTDSFRPDDFNFSGQAYSAQTLKPKPQAWLENGDACYTRNLDTGKSFTFYVAINLAPDQKARDVTEMVLAKPGPHFKQQASCWNRLWKRAFKTGNDSYSGSLADIEASEDLVQIASSSVINLLSCRRQLEVNQGKTFYNILTPRRCETCFYLWDWGLATATLAELDPDSVKRQLDIVWSHDYRRYNQYNFMTGDASGWPYSADTFSLFFATWNYWRACGASASDLKQLKFGGLKERKPMAMYDGFRSLAEAWRELADSRYGLANYGPKGNLLECISNYSHIVAALNAGAAWMLERMAEICEALDNTKQAGIYRNEASILIEKLLEHLYVGEGGYFQCIKPDGRKIQCRNVYDVGMVLWCIGKHLPEDVAGKIVDFLKNELMTPTWVRALSPHDADAGISGIRADHQFCGSYTAWPALCALGLMKVGEHRLVGKWLKGIAKTARQGPFGQAHWDERMVPPTSGGATKVTDEFPQGCHWSDISGGIYYYLIKEYITLKDYS